MKHILDLLEHENLFKVSDTSQPHFWYNPVYDQSLILIIPRKLFTIDKQWWDELILKSLFGK